jgi:hypothetical protein
MPSNTTTATRRRSACPAGDVVKGIDSEVGPEHFGPILPTIGIQADGRASLFSEE